MLEYLKVKEYDKKYKIKDTNIVCFSKDKITDYFPDGNYEVAGETIPKNRKDPIDTIKMGGEELKVSEYKSHSRIFYKVYGYVLLKDGRCVALIKRRKLIWILLFLVALVILGGYLYLNASKVEAPDFDELAGDRNLVYISLPTGSMNYHIREDMSPFSGGEIDVLMEHDGSYIKIHNQSITLNDKKKLENGKIDFPSQTFELMEGTYDGRFIIRSGNGAKELVATIIITKAKEGHANVILKQHVYISQETGEVKMEYRQENSSHDSAVQLILRNGRNENLLAQSGLLHSGDTLTSMQVNDDARSLLEKGEYEGIVRTCFYINGEKTVGITPDAVVKIIVI